MISITQDGIHHNDTQLIGGTNDPHAPLRLKNTNIAATKTPTGDVEITLTLTTKNDVILG